MRALVLSALVAAVMSSFSTDARAVSFITDDLGNLLGASNVNVGGNLFDVTFEEGTCVEHFGGCDSASDFTFQTEADALAASDALLEQVFLDAPAAPGNFDSDPSLLHGCTLSFACGAYTPYAVTTYGMSDFVLVAMAANFAEESHDTSVDADHGIYHPVNDPYAWALWTPISISRLAVSAASAAPTVMPLPAAGWLLASVLGVLFIAGRRRRRLGTA